jgi:hypothetical protein
VSEERFDPDVEQAFSQLGQDLPRVAPPDALRDSILAAVPLRERPAPVEPEPVAGHGWRRIPRVAFPAGVALAALVAALVIAVAVSGGPAAAAHSALVEHGGSGASGQVQLFSPATADGHLVVDLRGLPRAPAGEHYTVWVLRRGAAEMTPVASLSAGTARLDVPLPFPGHYAAVDISLQRDDAPATHSAHSVAGATLS